MPTPFHAANARRVVDIRTKTACRPLRRSVDLHSTIRSDTAFRVDQTSEEEQATYQDRRSIVYVTALAGIRRASAPSHQRNRRHAADLRHRRRPPPTIHAAPHRRRPIHQIPRRLPPPVLFYSIIVERDTLPTRRAIADVVLRHSPLALTEIQSSHAAFSTEVVPTNGRYVAGDYTRQRRH